MRNTAQTFKLKHCSGAGIKSLHSSMVNQQQKVCKRQEKALLQQAQAVQQ